MLYERVLKMVKKLVCLLFVTSLLSNVIRIDAHFFGKFREKPNYPIEAQTYFGDFNYNDDCPKQCRNTGDCCLGYICSPNPHERSDDRGICLYDKKEKDKIPCINDKDCYPYVCVDAKNIYPSVRFCQRPDFIRNSLPAGVYNSNIKKKQFNDYCLTSKDCDQESKLCCAYVTRHRLTPTLRCVYSRENAKCIDGVENDLEEDLKASPETAVQTFGGRNMNSLSRFFPMRLRPYFKK